MQLNTYAPQNCGELVLKEGQSIRGKSVDDNMNCVGCGVATTGSTSGIPCCFACYLSHNEKLLAAIVKKSKMENL